LRISSKRTCRSSPRSNLSTMASRSSSRNAWTFHRPSTSCATALAGRPKSKGRQSIYRCRAFAETSSLATRGVNPSAWWEPSSLGTFLSSWPCGRLVQRWPLDAPSC
jgi:hypothetical protein